MSEQMPEKKPSGGVGVVETDGEAVLESRDFGARGHGGRCRSKHRALRASCPQMTRLECRMQRGVALASGRAAAAIYGLLRLAIMEPRRLMSTRALATKATIPITMIMVNGLVWASAMRSASPIVFRIATFAGAASK